MLGGEVVSGAFDRLRDSVAEHDSWLSTNCEAQRSYYRSFVERRTASQAEAGGLPCCLHAMSAHMLSRQALVDLTVY